MPAEKIVINFADIDAEFQNKINSIIKHEGYEEYNIEIRKNHTDGDNFLAILYEVDIKGKTKDGSKEDNMFIKKSIPDSGFLKMISIEEIYKKESYAYNELFKVLTDLQNNAKIPVEDQFKIAKSYPGTDNSIIIMENLTKKGYKLPNKMEVISLPIAKVCIANLAKFHALSFALEKLKPEYFENTIKPLRSPFTYNEDWASWATYVTESSLQMLDSERQERVKKIIPKILQTHTYYTSGSTKMCLHHGDFRQSNILFKEINGELDVVILDYQVMQYNCPVLDFLYFFYWGTDKDFRDKHMKELKNLYYNTLAKFLQYFDMDANNVFSRDEFEKLFKEKLDFGLMIMLFMVPYAFTLEGEAPDMGEVDLMSHHLKLDKRYKERLVEAVDECIQLGFL